MNPGDRVILPEPTYSLYLDAVQLAGGQPVFVPTRPDRHLDPGPLEAQLAGARMVVVCNPVNPTGAVFGPAELDWLGQRLAGTDTLVLADEAYADIVYDSRPFTSTLAIPSLSERLIYVQTLSKTYAMTGWRIGYAVAAPDITAVIRHVHRTMNSAVNAAVQRAALAAISIGPSLGAPMLAAYQERRDFVAERIAAMDCLEATRPDGAFYSFARYAGAAGRRGHGRAAGRRSRSPLRAGIRAVGRGSHQAVVRDQHGQSEGGPGPNRARSERALARPRITCRNGRTRARSAPAGL